MWLFMGTPIFVIVCTLYLYNWHACTRVAISTCFFLLLGCHLFTICVLNLCYSSDYFVYVHIKAFRKETEYGLNEQVENRMNKIAGHDSEAADAITEFLCF